MVIKVVNNPGIKDVAWNIDKAIGFIPVKVLKNIGISFSSESNYRVLSPRQLSITEFTLKAKIGNSIKEDMTFIPWCEFFLEVQSILEEPTDTIVDIFLNAINTKKFSESDALLIATYNFCSLMKKVFERMGNMSEGEASSYFHRMLNPVYPAFPGKVGHWLYEALAHTLYLSDPECYKQYKIYLNGE